MNEKIEELAKKLQRLADGQGNANEKINAKRKLEELCKKYGFTTESLRSDKTYFQILKWKDEDNKYILLQVISQVINKRIKDIDFYNIRKNNRLVKTQLGVYLTDSQYMEILYLHSFYGSLWNKERKFLFNVFINKHYIFAECQPVEYIQRTPEEEMRVRSASRAMQDATLHKAITQKVKEEK